MVGLTALTGLGIRQANRRDNDIMEGGRGTGDVLAPPDGITSCRF